MSIVNTDLNSNISIKHKTMREMNSFYISHYFKSMYGTIDIIKQDNVMYSDDSGEKIFRDFLINEYSIVMSDKLQLVNDMFTRYIPDIESTPSINASV